MVRRPAIVTGATFLATAAAVAPLFRTPELAARWHDPSALADFRTSGLAGHLARAVLNVERYLDAAVPTGIPSMDAVSYFVGVGGPTPGDRDLHANRVIRERGEQDAGTGADDLADRFDAARARLGDRLPPLAGDRPTLMFDRYVLPLDEVLRTRVVELVVHADDLAISLGLPTPAFADPAADLAVCTLAAIARRRHGTTALVRALARHERTAGSVSAF